MPFSLLFEVQDIYFTPKFFLYFLQHKRITTCLCKSKINVKMSFSRYPWRIQHIIFSYSSVLHGGSTIKLPIIIGVLLSWWENRRWPRHVFSLEFKNFRYSFALFYWARGIVFNTCWWILNWCSWSMSVLFFECCKTCQASFASVWIWFVWIHIWPIFYPKNWLIYGRYNSIYCIESWWSSNLSFNSPFLFFRCDYFFYFKNFASNFSPTPLAIFSRLNHYTLTHRVVEPVIWIQFFLCSLLLNERIDLFKFCKFIF